MLVPLRVKTADDLKQPVLDSSSEQVSYTVENAILATARLIFRIHVERSFLTIREPVRAAEVHVPSVISFNLPHYIRSTCNPTQREILRVPAKSYVSMGEVNDVHHADLLRKRRILPVSAVLDGFLFDSRLDTSQQRDVLRLRR